jgi:hypothetical protein
MSAPRHGVAAAVDQAMAEAGDVPAVQPMLPLADPGAVAAAIDAGAHGSAAVDQARKAGRPKGSANRRTEAFRSFILARYPHPGEALAATVGRPVDVLAAELGCTKAEAFREQMRCAAELLPYIESKMPVAIGVSAEGQIQLVLASGAGAGAQVIDGQATLTGLDALAMATVENQGVEP